MYGTYRDSGIPALRSHAEALQKYKDTKPIRGRVGDQRPLGHRRRSHFQIAFNEQTNNVICRCYDTDVVTFEPSGDVVLNVPKHWQTGTTANFIGDVLGWDKVNVGIFDHSVVLYLRGTYQKHRVGTETRLRLVDGKYLMVSNDRKTMQYAVNRKVMNEARKSVHQFMQYAIGSIKLREGVFGRDEGTEVLNKLQEKGIIPTDVKLEELGWHARLEWSVTFPSYTWFIADTEKVNKWIDRLERLMQMVQSNDHEEMYLASVWIAQSLGGWRAATLRMEEYAFVKAFNEILMVATPLSLIHI